MELIDSIINKQSPKIGQNPKMFDQLWRNSHEMEEPSDKPYSKIMELDQLDGGA